MSDGIYVQAMDYARRSFIALSEDLNRYIHNAEDRDLYALDSCLRVQSDFTFGWTTKQNIDPVKFMRDPGEDVRRYFLNEYISQHKRSESEKDIERKIFWTLGSMFCVAFALEPDDPVKKEAMHFFVDIFDTFDNGGVPFLPSAKRFIELIRKAFPR